MSGGPFLPSSIYLGDASGNLTATYYVPATNTNTAGQLEGVKCIASLAADAPAVLQFNMPPVIPTGTLKLRILARANATTGTAKLTIQDGSTPAGSNIGAATLNTETQVSQTWTAADVLVEIKITLTALAATLLGSDILTVLATFNFTGFTLAADSVWQFSILWE